MGSFLWDDRADVRLFPLASASHHLILLLFGLQTALTTAVCIAEAISWPELSVAEKANLAGSLYGPYLLFGKCGLLFLG